MTQNKKMCKIDREGFFMKKKCFLCYFFLLCMNAMNGYAIPERKNESPGLKGSKLVSHKRGRGGRSKKKKKIQCGEQKVGKKIGRFSFLQAFVPKASTLLKGAVFLGGWTAGDFIMRKPNMRGGEGSSERIGGDDLKQGKEFQEGSIIKPVMKIVEHNKGTAKKVSPPIGAGTTNGTTEGRMTGNGTMKGGTEGRMTGNGTMKGDTKWRMIDDGTMSGTIGLDFIVPVTVLGILGLSYGVYKNWDNIKGWITKISRDRKKEKTLEKHRSERQENEKKAKENYEKLEREFADINSKINEMRESVRTKTDEVAQETLTNLRRKLFDAEQGVIQQNSAIESIYSFNGWEEVERDRKPQVSEFLECMDRSDYLQKTKENLKKRAGEIETMLKELGSIEKEMKERGEELSLNNIEKEIDDIEKEFQKVKDECFACAEGMIGAEENFGSSHISIEGIGGTYPKKAQETLLALEKRMGSALDFLRIGDSRIPMGAKGADDILSDVEKKNSDLRERVESMHSGLICFKNLIDNENEKKIDIDDEDKIIRSKLTKENLEQLDAQVGAALVEHKDDDRTDFYSF